MDKGKKAYLAGGPAQSQEAVRDTVCVRTTRNSVRPKSRAHGKGVIGDETGKCYNLN